MNKLVHKFIEKLKIQLTLLNCHARRYTPAKKFTELITEGEKPRDLGAGRRRFILYSLGLKGLQSG